MRYLYVTSFWEKINKRPPRLIILTLLSHSTFSLSIPIPRIPKGNALRLRPSNAMDGSTLKTRPPTFSTRIYSCSSTAVARFLQLRRYSLYVAHIQRCRSFDNPHPPPSRYSRISYILPISPKLGGRRARFRSSTRFFPPLQETDRYLISLPLVFSKRF